MRHVHAVLIGILTFALIPTLANEEALGITPEFEAQTLDKISIGYGVDVGDVDGDGKPDLLLADKKQFVWYQNPGTPGKAGAAWKKHVMVENLTARDNVAITAADINGDGKVEVAVGAMWNPGETNNEKLSGSVHYLIRPKDPTQKWEPVQLSHEPTTHRMRWVETEDGKFELVVLPLHGRGNKGGEGAGVKVIAYKMPKDGPKGTWETKVLDDTMHLTHNMDAINFTVPDAGDGAHTVRGVLVAGKEGLTGIMFNRGKWNPAQANGIFPNAAGEIRVLPSYAPNGQNYITTIEPMHGNSVVLYSGNNGNPKPVRTVLIDNFNQGHALAIADILGTGRPQVIAGWRNPNKERKVGIKLFELENDEGTKFKTHIIDDNKMACEDLKLADLDGDGKVDIIAAGRATKNLVVYWNKSKK